MGSGGINLGSLRTINISGFRHDGSCQRKVPRLWGNSDLYQCPRVETLTTAGRELDIVLSHLNTSGRKRLMAKILQLAYIK